MPESFKITKYEQMSEDEEDINVDDDEEATHNSNLGSAFSFSISNILSDNFGKISKHEKKIFRPYDVHEKESKEGIKDLRQEFKPKPSSNKLFGSINTSTNNGNIFMNNFRLTDIFDYSSKFLGAEQIHNNGLRSSLFNSFSTYPKIHEEIYNNHKKYLNHQTPAPTSSSRMPPLGSLCKTVSQIGQSTPAPSPNPSGFSSSQLRSPSVSSLNSSTPPINSPRLANDSNLMSPTLTIKSNNSSNVSNVEDSDDLQSENGKDGEKMWPAWIYCTRYSDRPSSGEFTFYLFSISYFEHHFPSN